MNQLPVKSIERLVHSNGIYAGCAAVRVEFGEGGEAMSELRLLGRIETAGPARLCLFTGAEPCLYLTQSIVDRTAELGLSVMVTTEGATEPEFDGRLVDFCLTPRLDDGVLKPLEVRSASELCVTLPGDGWNKELLLKLEVAGNWRTLWVAPEQLPEESLERFSSVVECMEWVLENPKWRLRL